MPLDSKHYKNNIIVDTYNDNSGNNSNNGSSEPTLEEIQAIEAPLDGNGNLEVNGFSTDQITGTSYTYAHNATYNSF